MAAGHVSENGLFLKRILYRARFSKILQKLFGIRKIGQLE